jgi:hypothetical protein
MKDVLKVALGVVTGIGGFLDAGTIVTCAQAGALFQFRLLWVVALGTLCVIFLSEMLGRLAAVSHHTLAAAIRERFGIRYDAIPLVAELFLDIIVLAAEIGGRPRLSRRLGPDGSIGSDAPARDRAGATACRERRFRDANADSRVVACGGLRESVIHHS